MSGKISPTISRSQTNRAHGPVSALNGPADAGPAPSPTHATNSADLDGHDRKQDPREQDERRFGQPRRHEVPVPEDHRREHAAGRGEQDRQLDEERGSTGRRHRPSRAPRRRTVAAPAASATISSRSAQADERRRATSATNAATEKTASETPRGRSYAGSGTTGEVPRDPGRAPVAEPGEDAETDGARRHEPEVAAGRRGPTAKQHDRGVGAQREPGEHRPVDVRQVLRDLRR